MSLKTDYKDDILATGNLRKYQMINNSDGTVSFQDVTVYEQTGDIFGAGDINKTNQAVNEKFDSDDVVDPMETTEHGFAADALAVKNQFNEQNKKIENNKYTNSTLIESFSPSNTQVHTLDWSKYDRFLFVLMGQYGDASNKWHVTKEITKAEWEIILNSNEINDGIAPSIRTGFAQGANTHASLIIYTRSLSEYSVGIQSTSASSNVKVYGLH